MLRVFISILFISIVGCSDDDSLQMNDDSGIDIQIGNDSQSGDLSFTTPLAKKTLLTYPSLDVQLGQGHDGTKESGTPLNKMCMEGTVTSETSFTTLGLSGASSKDKYLEHIPVMVTQSPNFDESPYEEHSSNEKRYVWGNVRLDEISYAWMDTADSKFIGTEAECGDSWMHVVTMQMFSGTVIAIDFPTIEDAQAITSIFSESFMTTILLADEESVVPAEKEKLAKALYEHGATISLLAFTSGDASPNVQDLLDKSECAVSNLDACTQTYEKIVDAHFNYIDSAAKATPLDPQNLPTCVGIYDYALIGY